MFVVNIYIICSKIVSWKQSLSYLFVLQGRLFKAFSVLDLHKCLSLQKLILRSSFSRLLAIREVTQLSSFKRIPGIDGKVFLTFTERFELSELLRLSYNNWQPKPFRSISILGKSGNLQTQKVPVISDRVWQLLIKYALEPIYEYFFHPHCFGFRSSQTVFDMQRFISFNLGLSANSEQKRVMTISFEKVFSNFNSSLFLQNLLAPRGVKIGIFRSFSNGFTLDFENENSGIYALSSLFANISLNGINDLHLSVRFGYQALFILKPLEDEVFVLRKVLNFLSLNKLCTDIKVLGIYSTLEGFAFLEWDYLFILGKGLVVKPSFSNYQQFLLRVKRILNNSNYGSNIKATKLSPIIKEWRVYNRFASLTNSRFSLFHLKRRAFKLFNKESRQDSYSAKKLVEKCFLNVLRSEKSFQELDVEKSPYFGHFIFSYTLKFKRSKETSFINFNPFCIHCGMKCLI